MPRSIELSDITHTRLVQLMGPDDTTESAVVRLLDFFKQSADDNGPLKSRPSSTENKEMHFTGTDTPDLTHTKMLKVQIDGLELPKAKWNLLLSHLAVVAFKNASSNEAITTSGIVKGEKTDSGYKFYPKANISIQGQDANDSWRMSVELAKKIAVDLVVECEWRDKVAAAHPGKKAILVS